MNIASLPSLAAALAFATGLAGTQSIPAQTASRPAAHASTGTTAHRSAARPTASACATVPVLSPKIPALPTSTPCAKTLYTITSSTSHLSPLLGAALRENLEKLDQSFSLNYVEVKLGTGELAQPHKWYTVNYIGYLTDGSKFDSSFDHPDHAPITFPYGAHRVIQGWDSGFEGMHVGGKRRLFIPYQLAYGEQGRPPQIPPKAELVFDMELVSQSDTAPAPPTPKTPPTAPGSTPGSTSGAPQGSAPGTATPPAGTTPGTAPGSSTPPPPQTPPKPSGTPPGSSATPPVSSNTPATSSTPAGTPPKP